MNIMSPDLLIGNIVTTRIRLARNLDGYPFNVSDETVAENIVKQARKALLKTDDFYCFFVKDLSETEAEALKEKHLISQALINNSQFGSAIISKDETLSIMIHEEDVIREQCFLRGLRLKEAYRRLEEVDLQLEKYFDFAFDKEFGYLTACPTNLGTGLRASVMLFLPALSETGKIRQYLSDAEKVGLTFRGLYGEGSKAEGYMYQISNEVTLGYSEEELLKIVYGAVEKVCVAEREEMEKLYGANQLATTDRAMKAFGVLTNAVILSYGEFLEKIAYVKIGAMMGMIDIANVDAIDDLISAVRPAVLRAAYKKKLSPSDVDLYRAEVVKNKLKLLADKN